MGEVILADECSGGIHEALNSFVSLRSTKLRLQAELSFLEWYYRFLLGLSIFMLQRRVGLETDAFECTYRYSTSPPGHSNGRHSSYPSFHSSGRRSTVGKSSSKAPCRSSSHTLRTWAGGKFQCRRSTSQPVGSKSCRIGPNRGHTVVGPARERSKPFLNPSKLKCPRLACSRPAVAPGGVE